MGNQAATPLSAPEGQIVVIPASVSALGPQLGRLPQELLHMIFKMVVTSMFAENSRFHECIDWKLFHILNRHALVNKIRNVSVNFTGFIMEALYENYHFAFRSTILKLSQYGTTFPPPLPRPHLRHHLRSMRIEILLENSYIDHSSTSATRQQKITTVEQLMAFCPSAWFLLHLTHPEVGFVSLRFLELVIRTDFNHFPLDDEFLGVLEAADFAFHADEVKITVIDINGVFVVALQQQVGRRIVRS